MIVTAYRRRGDWCGTNFNPTEVFLVHQSPDYDDLGVFSSLVEARSQVEVNHRSMLSVMCGPSTYKLT
jgi:hypothetical protein